MNVIQHEYCKLIFTITSNFTFVISFLLFEHIVSPCEFYVYHIWQINLYLILSYLSVCQTKCEDEVISPLWHVLPSHGYKQLNLALHTRLNKVVFNYILAERNVYFYVF